MRDDGKNTTWEKRRGSTLPAGLWRGCTPTVSPSADAHPIAQAHRPTTRRAAIFVYGPGYEIIISGIMGRLKGSLPDGKSAFIAVPSQVPFRPRLVGTMTSVFDFYRRCLRASDFDSYSYGRIRTCR